jgi:hypothetical protein
MCIFSGALMRAEARAAHSTPGPSQSTVMDESSGKRLAKEVSHQPTVFHAVFTQRQYSLPEVVAQSGTLTRR